MESMAGTILAPFHTNPPLLPDDGGSAAAASAAAATAEDALVTVVAGIREERPRLMPPTPAVGEEARRATLPAAPAAKVADLLLDSG